MNAPSGSGAVAGGRLALRIAFGAGAKGSTEGAAEAAPSIDEIASALDLLASNKVPLLSLPNGSSAGADAGGADPLWRSIAMRSPAAEAIEAERERKRSLLVPYLRVAGAFEEAGATPVLLKSPAWFPYRSSNLDVLVAPRFFEACARLLERMGHLRLPHYREDHKLLFRTFEKGEPALSVHLHEAVSWGKAVVLDGGEVAGRSVAGEDTGVRVAAPLDAMAATLAHTVLETDQVRLSDLRTVIWCRARGASVPALIDLARSGRWAAAGASALALYDATLRALGGAALLDSAELEALEQVLREHPWTRRLLAAAAPGPGASWPHRLPRRFSKEHLLRLILEDDRRDPDRKVLDLGASAWNLISTRLRVRARPAILVTVSGPDGAGKSRLADAIAGTLALCEVPVSRLWTRGGFTAAAVKGKALARRVAPSALPGIGEEERKRAFLRSPWRRALWTWLVALEQSLSLQRVRWRLLGGRSIVADRWVHDLLADLVARLPGGDPNLLPRRAAGFLLGAAPRPGIAFLIDVDPARAHERKADGTTVESRRDLARAYAALAPTAAFVRLDGNRPFEEIAQEAIETALRRCFAAFERKDA